jgi:choline dehydrogenase-like flavoprotein
MKRPGGINLYATNGASSSFIWKTRTAEKLRQPDPDLFVFSIPGWFRGYSVGWPAETLQQHNWLSWVILKGHTNNTGCVTLNADQPASPFQRPVINFNNFNNGCPDDADLSAIVEGLEFCHDLMRPAIQAGKARPYWPRPEQSPWDAEHFREHALREAWGHHASCTCPIGPDPRTIGKDWAEKHGYTPVLDSRFRVHGVSRLRVVDASVFPKIPGFFILMPTYMISEKAAQVISEDASRRDG